MNDAADITLWLAAARDGDTGALDRVLSVLYRELRQMARRQLGANQGATLNATALVHEAYLRISGRTEAERSEEHTSELQSLMRISYAVFCLKKKTTDRA